MATINLEINEEWLKRTVEALLVGRPSITITSDDGEGCPLGFHIRVTGLITRERVTINVTIG